MIKTENTIAIIVDCQEKLMPTMYNQQQLIDNIVIFTKGLNILGIPIIVTQQYTKGLGNTSEQINIHTSQCEHIEKITFDCCKNMELMKVIEKYNRENVLLCGIEAHICVRQTALGLIKNYRNVHLVTDCISSRQEYNKNIAMYQMSLSGISLTTYESALFELLEMAGGEKFKQILKLIK